MGLQPSSSPPWLRMANGGKIFLLNPGETDIRIPQIALTLARICRFAAGLKGFATYSVASHSVFVSQIVPQELEQAALLHDAAEAFMGCDMPGPLKRLFPDVKDYERVWEREIELAFGLEWGDLDHPEIKKADKRAQATERRDLLVAPYENAEGWDSSGEAEPFRGIVLKPDRSVEWAAKRFMRRAVEVGLA